MSIRLFLSRLCKLFLIQKKNLFFNVSQKIYFGKVFGIKNQSQIFSCITCHFKSFKTTLTKRIRRYYKVENCRFIKILALQFLRKVYQFLFGSILERNFRNLWNIQRIISRPHPNTSNFLKGFMIKRILRFCKKNPQKNFVLF